jgi:beta-galactosidase
MAKGYRAGVLVGTDKVETAGAPASLRLKTTRSRLLADEEDVSVVEVQVVDSAGRPVPTASSDVKFSVTGPGRIAGVGNGDPSSHEPDQASSRHAFNGRCMVLVGSTARAGSIVLHATSPGLNGATLTFTAGLGRARAATRQTTQPRRR